MSPQKLNKDFRGDLRFFAFFIGNGSLDPADCPVDYIYYDEHLNQPGPLLGLLFAVYLNTYEARLAGKTDHDPQERAAQYLAQQCLPEYTASPPFEPWEVSGSDGSITSSDAIKLFATAIGQGQLTPELLANVDYYQSLVEYGSFLELVFAIFSNVLEVGDDGRVVNAPEAHWRAAQCIRQYCDPTYQVTPPFEGWETELH